eukprot:3147672-Lingulodinium_polyedra.AAC.1
MDLDHLGHAQHDEGYDDQGGAGAEGGEEAWQAQPGQPNGQDANLFALKGKGKGQFNGACNFCGAWGHKASECRKKDAVMAEWRAKGGSK